MIALSQHLRPMGETGGALGAKGKLRAQAVCKGGHQFPQ